MMVEGWRDLERRMTGGLCGFCGNVLSVRIASPTPAGTPFAKNNLRRCKPREGHMRRLPEILLIFLTGLLIGALAGAPEASDRPVPIKTDFCFLSNHLDLFAGRRVMTTARIAVDAHGRSLEDPACPDAALPFESKLEPGKQDRLNEKLAHGSNSGEVPVTFVGAIHCPSAWEKAYDSTRHRLGMREQLPKPVTLVELISSSGDVLP
jgi:hypothetical protein